MINKKQLVLLGGIAVGKGYSTMRITKEYGDDVDILGVGDLVRHRLENDSEFNAEYGQLIADGNLVPEKIIIPMVMEKYEEYRHSRATTTTWEGYFRTEVQTEYALDKGIINPENCLVVDLFANRETLARRQKERLEKKPNGPRFDEGSFNHRMRLFNYHHPRVLQVLGRNGIRIITVNANEDLPVVADYLIEQIRTLTEKKEAQVSSLRFHVPETLGLTVLERLMRANMNRSAILATAP